MTASSHGSFRAFSYDLPVDRIAQRPVHPPESALLLISAPDTQSDSTFAQLHEFLNPGDLLVFNLTKVAPARLRGNLAGKSGAVELLLSRRIVDDQWVCLGKPLKKLLPGTVIEFGEALRAQIVERTAEKEITVKFTVVTGERSVAEVLEQVGEMPIPPYIRKGVADSQDRVDYQSIFARHPGSIAAPTASLHFSEAVLSNLRERKIDTAGVTLHLGSASFLPVYLPEQPDQLRPPGSERYFHSNQLLEQVAAVRKRGNRVIGVGTSVVRALESMAREQCAEGVERESSLFITPGFEFITLDGIVTNFHQPGTTHLLLVEAFIGSERLAKIYQSALKGGYRFLSYGDGMLLFRGA